MYAKEKRELDLIRIKQILYFSVQAVKKNIPILMDAERLREGLDDLLKVVDYVVCAAQFPQASSPFSLESDI